VGRSVPEGRIAGISYRIQGPGHRWCCCRSNCRPGNGGRWSRHWRRIEPRSPSAAPISAVSRASRSAAAGAIIGVVRGPLDQLAIRPGEQVVEVGCGSGVIMRELARRTGGANRLIGVDQNLYLMREARALAEREGLADRIRPSRIPAERP
jgi:2-polyprenyl-3-methyl-5-hydroxy-6-metoxy-1,4-benzoquinol methylase